MWRVVFCFVLLIAAAAVKAAPADLQAMIAALNKETLCHDRPGPEAGDVRTVCVWRPASAGDKVLPVLYMADGVFGVQVAVLDLKPALDAGTIAPMMVVATMPKAGIGRAEEYVLGWSSRSRRVFDAHDAWLIQQVMPWAESVHHASTERARRFIGGFSHGADWTLAMANRHPDIFGGAIVHSPVASLPAWVGAQAGTLRWVVTGGTLEITKGNDRHARLPRLIAEAIGKRGAPLRTCIGSWGHEGRYWRQLSGGSLVWLMGLGNAETAASALERENCR